MTKIIPMFQVEACEDCPHFGFGSMECHHEKIDGGRIVFRPGTIPYWCPLEDAFIGDKYETS